MSTTYNAADVKCKKHSDKNATANCVMCQAPICESCTQKFFGLMKISGSKQGHCPACTIGYFKRQRIKSISSFVMTTVSAGILLVVWLVINEDILATYDALNSLTAIIAIVFGCMLLATLILSFVIWPKRFKKAEEKLANWV